MFYLDIGERHIADAMAIHYQRFRCFIHRRLGLSSPHRAKGQCSICDSSMQELEVKDEILYFLGDDKNLTDILSGNPKQLLEANNRFWKSIFSRYNHETWKPYFNKKNALASSKFSNKARVKEVLTWVEQVKQVLDYDWFINKENIHYNAYQLTEALARETCTYCNRLYTSTVVATRNHRLITRPTLDHWYPKAEHPLLAVSFQNLIPSCYSCNSSVKGVVNLDTDFHIHPYIDATQNDDFQFAYFHSEKLNKYRIFIKDVHGKTSKSRLTLNQMHIDEIYNTHHSELKDILTIKKNYSKSYISSMQNLLGGRLTASEVYRLLFGVHYEKADFHRRPLSKFKYDILSQLDFLKDI